MIVTVTLNPSVDRTIEVTDLARGAVLRALSSRLDAGGKGVNVARAMAIHGHKAVAVVACGGAEGAQLLALLAGATGLDVRAVAIAGATRSNVTVVEADGTTTKLNEAGPSLSAAELEAVADATVDAAAAAGWVVLSGSLPPGAPDRWYGDLRRRLAACGCKVAVDTSGAALAGVVAAAPDLVKPNREELAELAGRPVSTVADAEAAAGDLRRRGVAAVLVSLGAAGAVLVEPGGRWHATAPAISARSSVGAGDALLAGFLASGAEGPAALREAVAWGSAAAGLPGSAMPRPTDIRRHGIHVTDLTTAAAPAHPIPEEP